MVNKLALVRIFLRVLRFSTVSLFHRRFIHIHLSPTTNNLSNWLPSLNAIPNDKSSCWEEYYENDYAVRPTSLSFVRAVAGFNLRTCSHLTQVCWQTRMAENYDMIYCVQKWGRLVQRFSSRLLSTFTVVVLVQSMYWLWQRSSAGSEEERATCEKCRYKNRHRKMIPPVVPPVVVTYTKPARYQKDIWPNIYCSHWQHSPAFCYVPCTCADRSNDTYFLRGRADKFCLHLHRKWTGKDILMK